ncbi:MAG: 4-hydroxythreonine-4-phosphate dehydrogenase PdxA [Candidatus Omnitrophota bacterium]
MRISHSVRKKIVISMGDPSGIGPEIILKSLIKLQHSKNYSFTIVGDYGAFQKAAKISKINISSVISRPIGNFGQISEKINFADLENVNLKNFRFGKSDKIYGACSIEYLDAALSIMKGIKARALVTAPICKASINRAGFNFPGHTEYLEYITKSQRVTMVLVGGPLIVSLVSRHIALGDVPHYITQKRIIHTTENTYSALKKFFKKRNPRIGIACLNPHAGDGELFGREEKTIINPAVLYLKRKIKGIVGPEPADTLFHKAYNGRLDAVVSMYHDQGLIPLKMIAFETGVNLSVGLPFIRTSPDHGTAFDIAGLGKANPASMIEAIKLAHKLC